MDKPVHKYNKRIKEVEPKLEDNLDNIEEIENLDSTEDSDIEELEDSNVEVVVKLDSKVKYKSNIAPNSKKFTVEEIDYIVKNHDKMTCDEMAKKLGRRVSMVSNYILQNSGNARLESLKMETRAHLRTRPFYSDLQRQFDAKELRTFEEQYSKMYAQFKDDVFHTEEMQILDIIKISIMCDRILIGQGTTRRHIEGVEYDILTEKGKPRVEWNFDYLSNLERNLAIMQGSMKNMSDEYQTLMKQKSDMLKSIKGTRDQRIKTIEDSKQTFTSLMSRLTENSEYRRQVGLDMEKYRLAMEAESYRLGTPITYEDGVIDRPLLNSETVLRTD